MGLALAAQLNVGTAASVDDVLPRLTECLRSHRFVILADDADSEALGELLKHVLKSSKPCALVLTSQFGSQSTTDILQRLRRRQMPFKFSLASDSLQAKLGGPIDGSTEEHDAVQHPVDDCEPAADVAGEVADDFPAEVPEQAGEAVDAYFGECA